MLTLALMAWLNLTYVAHCRLNVYIFLAGNQQPQTTSMGEIATSSRQDDGGESGKPSDGSGDIIGQEETETAETFKSTETSVINTDADSDN